MPTLSKTLLYSAGLLGILVAPAFASVSISSFTPSVSSPQLIGSSITWTAKATDTGTGPLTFQFNVAGPSQPLVLVKDFNVGKLRSGTWTSQPFVWVPTGVEGTYSVQVVIKDFTSGAVASKTVKYQITPLVAGSTAVAVKTANPLVALFSAPSCPTGSTMRVSFQPQSMSAPAVTTNYLNCHPPASMTFEIAGMYPSTAYVMYSQTNTGGVITNGTPVNFTTGALPSRTTFPQFTVEVPAGPQTDTADWVILQNVSSFIGKTIYANVATDLSGNIIWYYNPGQAIYLTRPLSNGTFLTIQSGTTWNPVSGELQLLQQVDLAGNLVKETNTGIVGHQLVAMGATDAQFCPSVPSPAPVGTGCLNVFHHDAIQLPNGYTAVFAAIEKIFPPGTQGDTSGLPVDIVGDMIIILNQNWQVVWYFDTFQHDGGAPQLDINRPAVLNETCHGLVSAGCPPMFLMKSGISTVGRDWLHANSLYYSPSDGDLIFSSRNQDWVMKVDYKNGTGTGNILWRMGVCGDFQINAPAGDTSWPWFSHQHDVGIENGGAGPLTVFDNGNTRWSKPSASTGCMPGLGSGNSRGMALTVDQNSMTVTPVLSVDLGAQGSGDGSAQLLTGGNYFYLLPDVGNPLNFSSFNIELAPVPATINGNQVLNIKAPSNYRAWRMPSLYQPPTT